MLTFNVYDFSIRTLHCVALVVVLHNKLRMLQIPSLVFEGVLFESAVNRGTSYSISGLLFNMLTTYTDVEFVLQSEPKKRNARFLAD